MSRPLVFIFLLLPCLSLSAQSYEVGVYGGFSYYDGDLAPNRLGLYFQTLRPAFGVFMRANVVRWVSLRAGYTQLRIMGDDAISGRDRRGLNFRTDLRELSLALEVNLFRLPLFREAIVAEGYLLGGAGRYQFNPVAEYEGRRYELQPYGTEGQGLRGYDEKYDRTQWNLIGGGGVKLHLSERWILGLEGSGRVNFTDFLDDVSDRPVAYQDVLDGNGPTAARLFRPTFDPERDDPARPINRGGPARDYVLTGGVTVTYVFGPDIQGTGRGGVKCPEF